MTAPPTSLAVQRMARLLPPPFERGADNLRLDLTPVSAAQALVPAYDFSDHLARFNRPPQPRYLLVAIEDVAAETTALLDYQVLQPGGAPPVAGVSQPLVVPAGSLAGSSFVIDLAPNEGPDTRLQRLRIDPPAPGGQASAAWRVSAVLGNLARLLWVTGWEADHIRRQMEHVKAQRSLAVSTGLSLDLSGYDLGIPRFPPLPYAFDDDTIALYHLDDPLLPTFAVEDLTTRYGLAGHPGVNTGGLAAPGAPGRFGSAFAFRDPNAEIVVAGSPDFALSAANSFTAECFVKPDTAATVEGGILVKHADPANPALPGWALSTGEFGRGLPGNVRFLVGDGAAVRELFVDESLPTTAFSHLAGVIDRPAGEARLYLNGVLRASASLSGLVAFTNAEPVRIGRFPGFPFQGTVDEVRFSRLARLNFDPIFGENDVSYRKRLRIFERWTLPTPANLLAALNGAVGAINLDLQPLVMNDIDSTLVRASLPATIFPVALLPGECIDGLGRRPTQEASASGTAAADPTFSPAYLVNHLDPARVVYFPAPLRTLAAGELPPDTHQMQVGTEARLNALLDLLSASGAGGQLQILSGFDPRAFDLRSVGRGLLLAHSAIGLGQLSAWAYRAGFAYVCRNPTLGGVYVSTPPGEYLAVVTAGGTATGAGGADLHIGETLDLTVRPALGAGALYRWLVIPCGKGRAAFTTRADRPTVTLQAIAPGKLAVKVEVTLGRRILSGARTFRVGLVELANGESIGADGTLGVTEAVAEEPQDFFHPAYLVTHNHPSLTYPGALNKRRMQAAVASRLDRLMDLIAAAGGAGTLRVDAAYDPAGTPLSAAGRAVTLRRNASMTLTAGQVAALAHAAGFTYVQRQDPILRLRMGLEELPVIRGPVEVAEGAAVDWEVFPHAAPTGLVRSAGALYVANRGTDTISEIDPATGRVRGALKVGWEPVALALSPDESRIYVANSLRGTITVLDLATGNTLAEIGVPGTPVALACHPANPRLYVACRGANALTQIDTGALAVLSSLNVGARPTGLAVRPGGAEVWVALDTSQRVNVVETAGFTSAAVIPLSRQPLGIAIAPDGARAYAALPAGQRVAVLDVPGRAVLGEVMVGAAPALAAVAPDSATVYLADTASPEQLLILQVQAAAPFLILRESLRVRREPGGLAADATRVYIANTGSNEISVVNPLPGQTGLDANWRLGSGLGESLAWTLSPAGGAQASLTSATAARVSLRGEHAGPLLAWALYSLNDATAPYTFEVRLKPALEAAGAIIRKDQYDLIMNILNTFHPIGVEVSTRALRERVVEVREGLLNAFPEYTYPNFRVRGPAPRQPRGGDSPKE
jgi:YVTN family beta-propeller protein